MNRKHLLFLCVFYGMLGGCGGNSGPATTSATSTRGAMQLTVKWPQLKSTRLVPATAQSIQVVLTASGQPVAQQVINRPAAGTNTTNTTFSNLPTVAINVTATAYPSTDGTGTAQATGTTTVPVSSETTAQASVTMDSTISSLALIPATPSVVLGQSVQLTVSALDAEGNVVLVTPGAWKWNTDNAQIGTVTANGAVGTLNGLAQGPVNVTITEQESGKSITVPASVTPPQTGGQITGHVQDGSAQPLGNVNVVTSDGANLYQATSDGNGLYTLNNVPAGPRVVSFSSNGLSTIYQVTVAQGGVITLDAILRATTRTITGPPVITVQSPQINQSNAQATLTGTITQLDSSQAVLIVDGAENPIPVGADGSFSAVAILRPGLNSLSLRATNGLGTTLSDEIPITYTPTNNDFYFRVTLTWDGDGDVDLHTWDPNLEHSYFRNKQISSGELDADNTQSFGPENFTCRVLTPGRYKFGIDAYNRSSGRKVLIHVTINRGPNAGQTFDYGPYTLTTTDGDSNYPVTGNTASWWRPVDIVVGSDSSITVQAPDTSNGLRRSATRSASTAEDKQKPLTPVYNRRKGRTVLYSVSGTLQRPAHK
jgi:hypothetical protein